MLARWLEAGRRSRPCQRDPAERPRRRARRPRAPPTIPRTRCRRSSCSRMKPYQLDPVAPALAPILDPETILGLDPRRGRAGLAARPLPGAARRSSGRCRTCRSRLGKGVIGLYSDSEDLAARALVTGLMAALGPCRMDRRRERFPARRPSDRRRPGLPVPLHRRARRRPRTALGLTRDQARAAARGHGRGRGGAGGRASDDAERGCAQKSPARAAPPRRACRCSTRTARSSTSSSARSRRRAAAAWKWPPRPATASRHD